MLATTAVVNAMVLITHDADFGQLRGVVPRLDIDDWLPSTPGSS
jgi:hypothetical protein